jgi:GNAT superfamily N-acetyltransferase
MTNSDLSYKIREATVDDIPLILKFIHKKAVFDKASHVVEATPERLKQELFGYHPKAFVFFAELEKETVGFAICFFTFSSFLAKPGIWVDDIFVLDLYRGKGVGTALLTYIARMAKACDYGRIEWMGSITNEKGWDFYKKNGAEVQERARVLRLDRSAIIQLARKNGEDEAAS